MNIKNTFLKLTSKTYPHGTEAELFSLLPKKMKKDEHGNLFIQIGTSSVMFTSHLDTADREQKQVNHVFDGNYIKTDGTSILGADDKAGVTIMLYMIKNKVPGLYYFFLGEEVGCIGSRKLAEQHKIKRLDNITKVVSFDRRNTSSVITHQSYQRTCSDEFAEALATQFNELSEQIEGSFEKFEYKKDPTGVCTDSIQFISIYSECTNISVGYYEEHTTTEKQDIKHLEKLAKTCCLVDWEALPAVRDYTKKEYSYSNNYSNYNYNNYNSYYGNDWGDYDPDYYYGYRKNPVSKDEKKYFIDRSFEYAFSSSVTIDSKTKKVKSVNFSNERINFEKNLIEELFTHLEAVYSTFNWTGEKGIVCYNNSSNFTTITRDEIAEVLPELNFWEIEVQRQEQEDFFDAPDWMW